MYKGVKFGESIQAAMDWYFQRKLLKHRPQSLKQLIFRAQTESLT